MAKEQKDADRVKSVRSEFEEASKKYDITEDCIIYVKSKETSFAEFPDVYEQFLTHSDIQKMTIFYMMDLTNLRGKGCHIWQFRAQNYVEYPINVHQFLSPDDNNLRGCKS